MDQNTQQGDSAFVPGLRMFRPDNAPQFVLGKLTITVQDLFTYIQQNPQVLSVYDGKQQLQVDLLWSKNGKPYCKLNTYNAGNNQNAPQAPQAPAGYPPAQGAPQGYPQQPQAPQAPQQQTYPPVQQPYGPYPQQAPQQGYPAAPPTYPQPQAPAPPAGYPPAQPQQGTADNLPF